MIYLDNSATTKQHPQVTEKMIEVMEEGFGNPSSLHRLGLDGEKRVKEARSKVLEAITGPMGGSSSGGSVVFVSGGTEADNMALFGAAGAGRRKGNRIVTTAVEHPAVSECLGELSKEGFEVVEVGVDKKCCLDIDGLEHAINGDTVLVSIMQVNNETGAIMPVSEAADIIRKKKAPALLHCDAVQGFGKIPVPAGVDLISVSGHKIHGPKGSGVLWIRDGVNIRPSIFGGGQEKGLRSGTENVPAIAGLGLASEIAAGRMKENFRRVSELRSRLLHGLEENIDDILVNSLDRTAMEIGEGEAAGSPYILNVSFLGTRGEVILHTLEQSGIYVSTGSACSSNKRGRSRVLTAMGLNEKEIEGAIRFSLCPENTMEEIDETVERTAEAVARFRKLGSFR